MNNKFNVIQYMHSNKAKKRGILQQVRTFSSFLDFLEEEKSSSE